MLHWYTEVINTCKNRNIGSRKQNQSGAKNSGKKFIHATKIVGCLYGAGIVLATGDGNMGNMIN